MQGGAGPPKSRSIAGGAGPRLLVAAVTVGACFVAGVAGATSAGGAPRAETLTPAETWSDRGVEPALGDGRGNIRVRVVLRTQALLTAASEPAIQAGLQVAASPGEVARRNPWRISAGEKAVARGAEDRYELAVGELQPVADQTVRDLDHAAAQIRRVGGDVIGSELVPAAVIARVPAATLDALEGLGSVQAIEAAPKPRPQSSIGWQVVGAPSWHSAGFTGGSGPSDTIPADAGVSSEVPDPTHPAFSGVPVDNYAGLTPSDHGTHTASVLVSQDMTNRGVAYGLDRLVSGAVEYQLGFAVEGHPASPDPAEVISTSFGSSQVDDNEGDAEDVTTSLFGVSQAASGGNENVDGSPTVQNIGRNTMSVAALNDVATMTTTDDVVAGFSSRGPTPGGRKKPDLIAPGGAVVAADEAWAQMPPCPDPGTDLDGTCRDYTPMSGTSFSGPHVAAAMTLLEGAGITDPMAQRAILINSARDWDGTNTGLHGWTAPQTGWRPEVGWGILNLDAALAQRGYFSLGEVEEGEAAFYRATVPAGSKATMAFQLRGYFVGYPGPPYPVQTLKYTVSNLDLRQYDSSEAEVAPPPAFDPPDTTIDPGPDAVDPNDTVEQVRSPTAPGSQTVTYKVQSASTIEGAATEPFALAAAAPLTPLDAPTVRPSDIEASPATVRCDEALTISARARNDSADLEAANASLTISPPSGVQVLSGPLTQGVSGGTLETSATSEFRSWTVQATSEGSGAITIEGAGDAYGTTFRDTGEVAINADCTPPGTTIDAGPEGPTSDPAPRFEFSGTGNAGGGFQCSLDSAPFTGCSSPHAIPSLADGLHTFRVRAVDAVGNADPLPPAREFTVDTQPPETTISSGPPATTPARTVTFALVGGASYECSLDGAGFSPCLASAMVAGLGEGTHEFAARSIDEAGNVDPTPAGRDFRVDASVNGARLWVKRRQHLRRGAAMRVRASLDEAGSIAVRATGRVGRRTVRLSAPRTRTAGSGAEIVHVAARGVMARRLARGLDHGPVRLKVRATFRDALGNRRVLVGFVRLRG